MRKVFFLLFYFIFLIHINAQNIVNNSSYYNLYDNLIGIENSQLYNGIVYKEEYKMTKENHKFFKDIGFLNGAIVYDGQPFFNINIKYSLFDNVIIVKSRNSSLKAIELINDKVKSFEINNHHFIDVNKKLNKNLKMNKFLELLAERPSFIIVKNHKKSKVEKYINRRMNTIFEDEIEFIMIKDEKSYKLNSKRDLIKAFPNLKSAINKAYNNQNRNLKKKHQKIEMIILELFKLEELNTL